jgi:hypothetical protein
MSMAMTASSAVLTTQASTMCRPAASARRVGGRRTAAPARRLRASPTPTTAGTKDDPESKQFSMTEGGLPRNAKIGILGGGQLAGPEATIFA